jgi:hypothetical protein
MAHAYALAAELAQPVARGYLTLTEAHSSLLATLLRADRDCALDGYDVRDVYRGLQHILGLHLDRALTRRAIAEMHVKQRVRPLLALRKPRNVLLAEAHGINGAESFPLTEPEVTDIADREIYFAGRRPHG